MRFPPGARHATQHNLGILALGQGDARAAEAAFAAAGARVFSGAFDALCGAETCDHRVPGTSTVAIVDRSHWTTEGSLYVAPFLACWLEGEGLLAS